MIRDFSATQAIIFDMDGVLFLSSDCHEQAYREVLQGIGIADFSYAAIAGMRTDDAMRKLLFEHGRLDIDYVEIDRLVTNKRKKALEILNNQGEVAPGSKELISRLRQEYRLAVASSASLGTVELFLKKSGYADAFEFCLNGSSVLQSKPDPAIYALAVQKLGLNPGQCVVIEDAVSGVHAASDAGVPVIAIAESGRENEFIHLNPSRVVSCLDDIGAILL